MAVVGEAEVRIVPDTRGFGQQVEKDIEDPVAKSAKRIGVALAAAFSVQQVGAFFKDAIDAASTAEEATSKVGVVFGESSQAVLQFADNATEAFGQSSNQALEATGTFGNLFRAIGLGEDQSAEFATTLTGLASDLASFNDVDVDEALGALRSGLVGETEPLKRFGVNLNQATIEAKALEDGLISQGQELDAATKAQATYSLILEQTALAQGDFARTSDGLANSQRQLSAEFENAKTEIGQGLLPIASELVGVASEELIPLITELAEVAVPLLSTAFEVAGPFIGSTTTILEALLPIVEVIGDGLDKIPTPLLQIVTAAVAFNKVAGPLQSGLKTVNNQFLITQLRVNSARAALESGGGLSGAANAGAAGLSKLNVAIAGATVAVGAGLAIYDAATKSSREYDAAVQEVAASLDEVIAGQKEYNEVLESTFEPLEELGIEELQLLDDLDISINDLKASAEAGGDILDPFREALNRLGAALDDNAPKAEIAQAYFAIAEAQGFAQNSTGNLFDKIEDLDNELRDGAEISARRAAATGDLTSAQEDAINAAITQAEETGNWAAATETLAGVLGPAAEGTEGVGGAASGAAGPVDNLTSSIGDLEDGLVDTNQELTDYVDNLIDAFGGEVDYADAVSNTDDALAGVAEAEDALAKARGPAGDREAALAAARFAEAEAELNRVRADPEATALDRLNAEQALADAYGDVIEASQAVANAEADLADAKNNLRDASEKQAEAARDVAIANAEAAGSTDVAREGANAFAGEINTLAGRITEQLGPESDAIDAVVELGSDVDALARDYQINIGFNADAAKRNLRDLRTDVDRLFQSLPDVFTIEDAASFLRRDAALASRFGIAAASGFYGTVSSATPFVAGEAGTEDVLVVPTAIGGIAKVVADLASQLGQSTTRAGGQQASGGVVIGPGAIQVVAGPDASPQAIAREVIDRLGYEMTVRGDG